MKIAIVTERIEAWRGGAETSTMELARLLRPHGHEVHVVTSSRCPSSPDVAIHMVKASTVLRPLRTTAFIRQATRYLDQHRFDLVHAVLPLPCADVYQPRGGLVPETIERNIAMRSTAPRRLFKRALMKLSVKQQRLWDLEREAFRPGGPAILAVSNYVARQCEKYYDVGPPRVRVVYNGVNAPRATDAQRTTDRALIRRQYHVAEDHLLLMFVAHNFRLKGLIPLIHALARLRQGGFDAFRMLVVGRENPVPFARLIRSVGLADHVVMSGPTSRVAAFYHASDVCILPTYYDPCSRVILEALSRGVPCITTRSNGASEVMTDGEDGYILESADDVAGMADRILAMRSPDVRSAMSRHALMLGDRISMTRHVAELHEVYTELASNRRRST